MLQLYLHFPFCKRKCFYCDFCSVVATAQEQVAYAAMLEKEIRLAAKSYKGNKISTVFIGGGTPSLMPRDAMENVMRTLRDSFPFGEDVECTVEANPGTLTADWLAMMREYGINRLSLGVQAVQEKHLRALGRVHTFDQAKEATKLARGCGIENLNLDVMFGLPGQSLSDYRETLSAVVALSPTHISAYSLILEEGTELWEKVLRGECRLPCEDETAQMLEEGAMWLAGEGYVRYEISNFAKSGYECRHNLGYWQGAWYLGLGLNAHSMLPAGEGGAAYLRVENTADMAEYRKQLDNEKLPILQSTPVSPKEAMFETMMLGLRTLAGVSGKDFRQRHGRTLEAVYGEALDGLVEQGLGIWQDDPTKGRAFVLTNTGLLLQNTVLLKLME